MAVHGTCTLGTICLYDREKGYFYGVMFDEPHEYSNLTVSEYEALILEYGLLEYAVQPELIKPVNEDTPKKASAKRCV